MDYFLDCNNQYERLLREFKEHKSLIVAYDFDNTVFDYHNKGLRFDNVVELLRECNKLGFYLIVYTCNKDKKYGDIKEYLLSNNIPFNSINENAPYINFGYNKLYYNILLDDRAGLKSAYETLLRLVNTIKNN